MSEFMDESYQSADQVIGLISKEKNIDYSEHREEIARTFDEYLYNGNWDMTTDIGIDGVREIRFIQEDEYDQHMDEDPDRPDWDDMIGYTAGHYIWFV